jgi:hypothetical protein
VAAQVAAASSAVRRVRNVVMVSSRGVSSGAIALALMIGLTLGEVPGGLELDETGD